MVALGAGGTWLALFGPNPASARPVDHPRLIRCSAPIGSGRRNHDLHVAAPTYPMSVGRGAQDVRISPIRRLGSMAVLALVLLGIAMSVAALLSAVIVMVVTILS